MAAAPATLFRAYRARMPASGRRWKTSPTGSTSPAGSPIPRKTLSAGSATRAPSTRRPPCRPSGSTKRARGTSPRTSTRARRAALQTLTAASGPDVRFSGCRRRPISASAHFCARAAGRFCTRCDPARTARRGPRARIARASSTTTMARFSAALIARDASRSS